MTESLKTITVLEGDIQENPFEIKAKCPTLLSSEAMTVYNTGLKIKLPNTIDLKFHNTNRAIVISHFFTDDILHLVLIQQYGGWIQEGEIIVKSEFILKQKANVRFVKMENGKKILNIPTKEAEVINIEEKWKEINNKIEKIFNENKTIESPAFIELSYDSGYSHAFFNMAKKHRDMLYVVPSESYKLSLINNFTNGHYKGKLSFILSDNVFEELSKTVPFPKYIIIDSCNSQTLETIKQQLNYYKIKDCLIFVI